MLFRSRPIALGVLTAMGVLDAERIAGFVALGELALDGALTRVAGVLPAALHAARHGLAVICPASCGGEAAWAGDRRRGHSVVAAPDLLALINHLRGSQSLAPPEPRLQEEDAAALPDLPVMSTMLAAVIAEASRFAARWAHRELG